MDSERLLQLLRSVREGQVTPDDAVARLTTLPFEDLGFAHIDHHRALRDGFPEVVLGLGKTPEQVAAIGARIVADAGRLLVTRATRKQYAALATVVPTARFHEPAGVITVESRTAVRLPGVAVVSAGTGDLAVAEEAAITAEMLGSEVQRVYDVGVAGLHRLLAQLPLLRQQHAIVVVAGMDGALPSVVGGLVTVPVVAVPTSVGYGASFGGLAALLGMLNSCAAGVSVVNIDNGFGGGYAAALINRLANARDPRPR
ncbi:MAG: nickel pincer cofactor biosynthesis protein LarB [Dehalococcoidia bacterium]